MDTDVKLRSVEAKEKMMYYMHGYIVSLEEKLDKSIPIVLSICTAAFVYGIAGGQTIVLYFVNFIILFIAAYAIVFYKSFLIIAAYVWHLEKELNDYYGEDIFIWNSKLVPKYRKSIAELGKGLLVGFFTFGIFGVTGAKLIHDMRSVPEGDISQSVSGGDFMKTLPSTTLRWINITYIVVCIIIIIILIVGLIKTNKLKNQIVKALKKDELDKLIV